MGTIINIQSSTNPPTEIALNELVNKVINGKAGEREFCMNCEQYEDCDHKEQRILDCNNHAIDIAYDIMNGGRLFGELDINNQPLVWQSLVNIAISRINHLKNEDIKKQSKKK